MGQYHKICETHPDWNAKIKNFRKWLRKFWLGGETDKEVKNWALNTYKENHNFNFFQLNFPGTPKGSYWLLDTDYDNYAAVYSW